MIIVSYHQGAPPRTRGWTLLMIETIQDDIGSPAHAGMDRMRIGGRGAGFRLPRARGDGP